MSISLTKEERRKKQKEQKRISYKRVQDRETALKREIIEKCPECNNDFISYLPGRKGRWKYCEDCRNISRYESRKRWFKKNPSSKLLWSSYSNAYVNGVDFNLTREDLIVPDICPVLGIPLYWTEGKRTPNTPTVDRIDPTKGYTKNNIVVVSWKVNELKRDATVEELIKIANFYKQFRPIE